MSAQRGGRQNPGRQQLAERLAGYVVLANDPAVPTFPDGAPFHRPVLAAIEQAIAGDPVATRAYRQLAGEPDPSAEQLLASRLAGLLGIGAGFAELGCRLVEHADAQLYQHLLGGPGCQPDTASNGLQRLAGLADGRPSLHRINEQVHLSIPVLDRADPDRIRTLVANLLMLNDQGVARERYRLTAVEIDDSPHWQHVIAPLADNYLHLTGAGLLDTSWARDGQASPIPTTPRLLCLLEADVLVERDFLRRQHGRLIGEDQARPDPASLDGLRGLLARTIPDACRWIRSELHYRITSFDGH